MPEGFRDAVEAACNAEIAAGRRIDVRVLPRDEAFAIPDIIRTATNLVPPEVKDVRIVDIVGLDQQADGGTHVASTSQIGRIEVVKIENKGKGFRRLRIRDRRLRRTAGIGGSVSNAERARTANGDRGRATGHAPPRLPTSATAARRQPGRAAAAAGRPAPPASPSVRRVRRPPARRPGRAPPPAAPDPEQRGGEFPGRAVPQRPVVGQHLDQQRDRGVRLAGHRATSGTPAAAR